MWCQDAAPAASRKPLQRHNRPEPRASFRLRPGSPLARLQLPYSSFSHHLFDPDSHKYWKPVRAKHCPLPNGAWEDSMHPQTLNLDSLWLVPPALALTFMFWVLWSWFKEGHRH
jgi:hypothetical protein